MADTERGDMKSREEEKKAEDRERRKQRYEDEDWVKNEVSRKGKEVWIAYLLWFIGGTLGVHRFYLGETNTAVAMVITFVIGWATTVILVGFLILGVLGIWVIVDLFTIPGMVEKANEKVKLEAYDELRRRKDALGQ